MREALPGLDHAALALVGVDIARAAGAAIMAIYAAGEVAVERKHDGSPLTAADLAAHRVVLQGLAALAPTLPVLSEESADEAPWRMRRGWSRYWLVDPLDGTREFIARNGEFTVNIALIENGEPTIGVVHAPALDETFYAWRGGHAFARTPQGPPAALSTRRHAAPLVVVGSRSHGDARLRAALERLGAHGGPARLVALGSSLKFCRIAQGRADLYLRHGPTSEWDTAAGQCVLEQAGGGVRRFDGARLVCNAGESLLNPEFFAYGDASVDWANLLREAGKP